MRLVTLYSLQWEFIIEKFVLNKNLDMTVLKLVADHLV